MQGLATAASGRRSGLRAGWMSLVGAGLLCVPLLAAQTAGGERTASSGNFVGAETCAPCHEKVAGSFASNPHSKLAKMHSGVTCEACHGAGKEHVAGDGDKSKIFNPATASAKDVDAKCLSCHSGKHADFDRSSHAKAGISCVSCHSIHDAADQKHLLKTAQPALCFQCHSDLKPQFSMPSHHNVNEGKVQCTDCHDPHGTMQGKMMRSTADQNATCTKCHTKMAGPFVYAHPVVKVEGCTSCHTPHGSQNAHLLNVSNVNTQCRECHSSPHASALPHRTSPAGSAHDQMPTEAACTSCHTHIHGSNADRNFLK